MKKKIFQLIPLLVMLIACSGHSYAKKNGRPVPSEPNKQCSESTCNSCEVCPPCKPVKPCCTEVPVTGVPCNCAYSGPARIDPACGWDANISLGFIYWMPKLQGLDLGVHKTQDATGNINTSNPIKMASSYQPGFKVGAGISTDRDNWTVNVEYTRLKSKDNTSKDLKATYDGTTNYVSSPWMYYHTYQSSLVKSTWEMDYNIFDLELGRPYYLGKELVFKPQIGLKAGWIDQSYNLEGVYAPGTATARPVKSLNSQDTWLFGPRAGLDTSWLIGSDFSIFGNIAGSLAYQKSKVSNSVIVPKKDALLELSRKGAETNSFLAPGVEFGLGLAYGTYFCNNEWHIDVKVGYDFNYIWNQNFMKNLKNKTSFDVEGETGDLILHGLTITARLDF